MRKIYWLIIGLSFLATQKGYTQESFEPYSSKLDFGINVTSVISSFTGNGSFLNPSDQPILIRWYRERTTFRIGLGIQGSSNEFDDFITDSRRTSSEQEYYLKIGIENPIKTNRKLSGYYGIDFVGNLLLDKVEIETFTSSMENVIKKTTTGFGISPFIGIRYYLGKKVYLSTEANFLFLYEASTTSEENINMSPVSTTTNSELFELNPPLFLYFNFKF